MKCTLWGFSAARRLLPVAGMLHAASRLLVAVSCALHTARMLQVASGMEYAARCIFRSRALLHVAYGYAAPRVPNVARGAWHVANCIIACCIANLFDVLELVVEERRRALAAQARPPPRLALSHSALSRVSLSHSSLACRHICYDWRAQVPVQMWQRRAQVPMQMWQQRAQVPVQMWQG